MDRRRVPAALFAFGLAIPGALVDGSAVASPGPPPRADAVTQLPPGLDADGDGWADTVETELDSDPSSAASQPESVAIPESCMNGEDDDQDGATDDDDAGCQPPDVARRTFPAAGTDAFDSTMTLDDYPLATPGGICPVDFVGAGPTTIERSDPVDIGGGLMQIDAEMRAMQLEGLGTLLPNSPCNPGPTPLAVDLVVLEDPAMVSAGEVTDTNSDADRDFPADSFFDVFFLVVTPTGVLPGGPPNGPIGAPVRVANTIRTLPPYFTPANPRANPNCYTVAGLPHQHCPKPPLDHFKCYLGRFPEFRPRVVTLEDQFGRVGTRVVRPDRFCNPVSKNGLEIFDPGGHLKRYRLQAIPGQPVVEPFGLQVLNQFGLQDLQVRKRIALFVPTQKNRLPKPLALDHFTCYAVTGVSPQQRVRLVDQFDVQDGRFERATVLEPRTLCAPTTKTVGDAMTPVGDPEWHLVCYRIETQRFRPRTIVARNQFGKERVLVVAPVELCVPSMKLLQQPPPPPPPEIEIDEFPNARITMRISQLQLFEDVVVQGPATLEVDLPMLADPDTDGSEQVPIEIVSMSLVGVSPMFGNVTVTARAGSESPFQAPVGEFEENVNGTPGLLDVPPFAPAGTIDGLLDIAFEVTFTHQQVTETLHTCSSIRLTGTFTHKPPAVGETWTTAQVVPLCNDLEEETLFMLGPVTLTTNP